MDLVVPRKASFRKPFYRKNCSDSGSRQSPVVRYDPYTFFCVWSLTLEVNKNMNRQSKLDYVMDYVMAFHFFCSGPGYVVLTDIYSQ